MTLAFDALDAPHSPLAGLDARWKLAAFLVAGAAIMAIRDPRIVFIGSVASIAMLVLTRIPVRRIRSRLIAFGFFLLPFLIVLPIVRGRAGFLPAAIIGMRAAALFALALIVVATAPFHRTMQAAQALGMPRVLTQVILLSYRYLFVLRDEFVRIRTALRVRGFRAGTTVRAYHTIGLVTGSLLLRGEERAERVAHAMRCRGFDGRFRSLSPFRTRRVDVMCFVVITAIAIALCAADVILRY